MGGDMSENDQKQSLNFRCSEATSGQNYSSDLSASLQNESYDAKKEALERGGRINKADLRSSLECAAVRALKYRGLLLGLGGQVTSGLYPPS